MADHLLDGHGVQQVAGEVVNGYGYPPNTVPRDTLFVPPGCVRATTSQEIRRLLRLHREEQPGYADPDAIETAIRRLLDG